MITAVVAFALYVGLAFAECWLIEHGYNPRIKESTMFTALRRDDFIYSADSLDAVLAFVLDCIDPTRPEDAVVWRGGLVVAMVLATGCVIRLDAMPVPQVA